MGHERILANPQTLLAFITFLRAEGTPIPAKPNEHFRARWSGRMVTIVAAKGGGWRLSSAAFEAWVQFQAAQAASANSAKVGASRARHFKSIALRDGTACFYCGRALTPVAATIEHLVPRAHNGPGNMRNLALACEPCNKEARDLAVAEKVRLRDAKRAAATRA